VDIKNNTEELNIVKSNWYTGSGNLVVFGDIVSEIKDHTQHLGKVYIGCDSQMNGNRCTFVTAICLHGGVKKTSKYFFKREQSPYYQNRTLRNRIDDEVSKAIDIFMYLSSNISEIDVEIHIDIGNTERSKTRNFVDSITGWVRGLGVSYKIKPNAWASASVADKHTK